jgi:hypothetical protein
MSDQKKEIKSFCDRYGDKIFQFCSENFPEDFFLLKKPSMFLCFKCVDSNYGLSWMHDESVDYFGGPNGKNVKMHMFSNFVLGEEHVRSFHSHKAPQTSSSFGVYCVDVGIFVDEVRWKAKVSKRNCNVSLARESSSPNKRQRLDTITSSQCDTAAAVIPAVYR